jgi:hypothetical protein
MGTPHYHPCTGDCPTGLTAGAVASSGGRADVITKEGDHRYWSTHCRHGNHDACSADAMLGDVTYDSGMAGTRLNVGKQVAIRRKPAQCKTCAAPCVCGCHVGGTEWAPGAGVARIQREMPGLMPELTDEDMRKADEVIAQAEARPGLSLTVRPPAPDEVEAFTAAFKAALNQPLQILPPSRPTRAEIRAAVFAELRANLDSLKGNRFYRPYIGERFAAHTRQQVEEWLDRQERIEEQPHDR